ncbi:M15 family metallopeptidase [Streptomyces sp. SID13031]|uniref:M15 family metallopeptidase n=1 Tax=Streptomyces sp. SID13031 TaxID=2706046 RepID=UPI0013C88A58|nr:M15 family metallopeptidase [Streptomyces sp. SID13031]NEA35036.1 peptidase M15 [Streptomyces sp. SID13031]
MTNDLPPRRPFSVRARLLSVTGVVVVASLVIWHAQVIDLFSPDSAADKQPVVAGGPNGSPPPVQQRIPVKKTAAPSKTPTTPAKPKKTPSPKATKSTRADEKTQYSEESIEALSPKLRSRLKKAMAAAKAAGVPIRINSGRRSKAKQARLLKEAIQKYGSYEEATRWVLPPEKSMHVQGKAVDIAPQAAMAWLGKNGWKYGICRRYDNEPWHFEALTAPGTKCPPIETNAVAERG